MSIAWNYIFGARIQDMNLYSIEWLTVGIFDNKQVLILRQSKIKCVISSKEDDVKHSRNNLSQLDFERWILLFSHLCHCDFYSPALGLGQAHLHLRLPQNLTIVFNLRKHGAILWLHFLVVWRKWQKIWSLSKFTWNNPLDVLVNDWLRI